ncbi:MAG: histidine kinase [Bacteroidota bacterium]
MIAFVRQRYRLIASMIGVGMVAGVVVKWMGTPEAFAPWLAAVSWTNPAVTLFPWECFVYGIIYSTGIWSSILVVRSYLHRVMPLRSWRALAVHVTAITAISAVVFTLIYIVEVWVCETFGIGDLPSDGGPELGIIVMVSSVCVMMLTTITYAGDFYTRLRDAEQAALNAELSALRAQINPHFLFNTLNSIAALVHVRPNEAETVIEQLSDLFRYTLRASKQPRVTLTDELAATEQYIAIEQARFQERLVVVREIDPALLDAEVPSLILQPIVENAVKHGVAKSEEACAVRIRAQREAHQVVVQVRDTGPGFDTTDESVVLSRGTGLSNVAERLRLHFGSEAHVDVLPDGIALAFPFWTASDEVVAASASKAWVCERIKASLPLASASASSAQPKPASA